MGELQPMASNTQQCLTLQGTPSAEGVFEVEVTGTLTITVFVHGLDHILQHFLELRFFLLLFGHDFEASKKLCNLQVFGENVKLDHIDFTQFLPHANGQEKRKKCIKKHR